jgi:hypothetical protein
MISVTKKNTAILNFVHWMFSTHCIWDYKFRNTVRYGMLQPNQRESRWQAELCLDPENGGDMILRNIGWLSTEYTVLYIPQDSTLHNQRCENLKSYKATFFCFSFISVYTANRLYFCVYTVDSPLIWRLCFNCRVYLTSNDVQILTNVLHLSI